jgi:hypothetical protein
MHTAMLFVCLTVLAAVWPAVAQPPLFDFHNAFWMNLHHYLHATSRPGGLKQALPAEATASERDAWSGAVATYGKQYGRRSLLFDEELVRVKLVLAAAESREPLAAAGLPEAMHAALVSAAPVYRRHLWPAHDAANRQAIAAAGQLVERHGRAIAARLSASSVRAGRRRRCVWISWLMRARRAMPTRRTTRPTSPLLPRIRGTADCICWSCSSTKRHTDGTRL